jgi:hypothetical protein
MASLKLFFGVTALTLLLAANSAHAKQQIFFGEDEGLGESTRQTSTPNADAARNAFLAALNGPTGTEDFEGFTAGDVAPLNIEFGIESAVLSAALSNDAEIVSVPGATDTNGFGRYPISGENFWDTFKDFEIQFSGPVTSFGFYAVDIGDFDSQLSLTLLGPDITIDVPHEVGAPKGSVIYFGVRSQVSFTGISFANSQGEDKFAFDDFTVSIDVQSLPLVSIPVNHPLALALAILLMGGLGIRSVATRT